MLNLGYLIRQTINLISEIKYLIFTVNHKNSTVYIPYDIVSRYPGVSFPGIQELEERTLCRVLCILMKCLLIVDKAEG